jgi:hypothetical protein
MLHMLVVVMDDDAKGEAIIEGWKQAGVKGVTLLDSTGMGRIHERAMRDDLPLFPSLKKLFAQEMVEHRLFFAVIDDDETLEKAVAAAHAVVGDFDHPHTGVMFELPVAHAWGLGRRQQ